MSVRDDLLAQMFLAEEPRVVLRAAAAVAERSCGRVRNAEGCDRRTGRPERGGLYCARIFGPVDDLACLCGKLGGERSAGQVCDRCGVLCGERRLRAERWGHVESPVPLVHPRLVPEIAADLACSSQQLLAVLRGEAALGDDGEVVPVCEHEQPGGGARRIAERLGARAQALMFTRVPVTPPASRGTRRDPQDAAYAQLILRCSRLERLIELDAPQIILDNELRMTQLAFDRVYEVARRELLAGGPAAVTPAGPDVDGLLAAIFADPEADAPRRAYADALRAVGDAHGEFIDLQLARRAGSRPGAREADLLRRNYDRWVAPFGAIAAEVGFRRGFPASCKVAVDCPQPRIGDPAWATIERLDSDLLALIADPALRGLTGLGLASKTLGALAEAGVTLPRVDTLELRLPRCPPAQVEAVTGCAALPGVRELTLVHASARGGQDWRWLDGTPLARQIEGLTLVVAFARVESFALAWCVRFMQVHRQLERLDVVFGRRLVVLELRREGEWLGMRVRLQRRVIEAIALGDAALAGSIAGLLTAIDPYGISSLRVGGPGAWFGDELAGLARALRGHFGGVVTTPAIA